MTECPFCDIVAGDIPAKVVAETEHALAFHDIAPRAAVHILVIPKSHHRDVAKLAFAEPEVLTEMMQLATKIADEKSTGSFRITFNTGKEAGQTVWHAHLHLTSRTPKDPSGN
jgi:histidine triad (HIT) family protein